MACPAVGHGPAERWEPTALEEQQVLEPLPCLSLLLFVAVTKQQSQKQLKEDSVYFRSWSQRVRVHCAREAWQQSAGVMIWRPRPHTLPQQRTDWNGTRRQQGCASALRPFQTLPTTGGSVQMPEPRALLSLTITPSPEPQSDYKVNLI